MKKDSTNLDKSDIWLFWISCFFESRLLRFDLDSMLPMQQYVLFVFLAVFASSEIIVKIFVFWPVNFYYFGFDLPNWKRRSQNKNESRISYDSKLMKIYEWGKISGNFWQKAKFLSFIQNLSFSNVCLFSQWYFVERFAENWCVNHPRKRKMRYLFSVFFSIFSQSFDEMTKKRDFHLSRLGTRKFVLNFPRNIQDYMANVFFCCFRFSLMYISWWRCFFLFIWKRICKLIDVEDLEFWLFLPRLYPSQITTCYHPAIQIESTLN